MARGFLDTGAAMMTITSHSTPVHPAFKWANELSEGQIEAQLWGYATEIAEAYEEGREADAVFLQVGYDSFAAVKARRERYAHLEPLAKVSLSERAQELKTRVSVIEVIEALGSTQFQKMGKSYKAICPFHGERTPSLDANLEKNVWFCFSCRRGGDVFTFVQELFPTQTFAETIRIVAAAARLEPEPYLTPPRRPERQGSPKPVANIGDYRIKPTRSNIRVVFSGESEPAS
jgi:hypothetical protein